MKLVPIPGMLLAIISHHAVQLPSCRWQGPFQFLHTGVLSMKPLEWCKNIVNVLFFKADPVIIDNDLSESIICRDAGDLYKGLARRLCGISAHFR